VAAEAVEEVGENLQEAHLEATLSWVEEVFF
jgi:hypothetical protein